jgi:hypothetical protein
MQTVDSTTKIDSHQLRALVSAFMKTDRRGMINPFTSTRTGSKFFPPIVGVMMVNLMWSGLLAMVIKLAPDLFSGLIVAGFGAAMLLSLQVLLEIDRLIVITDDALIVGPLPVNSRTYFAAKVTHFLAFVTILSLSTSFLPGLIASITLPIPLVGPIIVIHFWLTALCCSLTAAVFYMLALRAGFGRRIERILGYLQFLLVLSVYYGMQFMPDFLQKHLLTSDSSQSPYWKLLPSYWFASWVKLAQSGWDLVTFLLGLFGFVLLFVLWKLATSTIDLASAETTSRSSTPESGVSNSRAPAFVQRLWNRFTCPEDRALAALAWAQFKFDTSFRIAVLSVFPFMAFWIFQAMTSKDGSIQDPFLPIDPTRKNSFLFIGFMASFIPGMVQNSLQFSKAWQASWLYYAAPTDYTKLLRATSRLMTLIVSAPIGIVMTVMLSYSFGNPFHALLQTLFVLAIAGVNMALMNLMIPALPFSASKSAGSNIGRLYITMIVSVVFAVLPILAVGQFGFGGYLGWGLVMIILLGVLTGLNRLAMKRYARRAATWEFVG